MNKHKYYVPVIFVNQCKHEVQQEKEKWQDIVVTSKTLRKQYG